MKKLITTFSYFYCLTLSFGQNTEIKKMVDSLQYLKVDTLDCSATLYWRIVAHGDKAIPFLIDKLNDTTFTSISYRCKKTKLNVGEVASFALQEIAHFPAFAITHIKFDVFDKNGCWSFFDYLFNNANKRDYQNSVRQWYHKNKGKFKMKRIQKSKLTECRKLFNITKYYKWSG